MANVLPVKIAAGKIAQFASGTDTISATIAPGNTPVRQICVPLVGGASVLTAQVWPVTVTDARVRGYSSSIVQV